MAKKGRRWSNLDGQLPEEPVELSDREVKIRAECDRLRGFVKDEATGELVQVPAKTMRELAQDYAGLCEEETFESLAKKERSVRYEALERVIRDELLRVQELSGQDAWRGEGQTFTPSFTPVPSVIDKAALKAWAIEHGHAEYLYDVKESRLKELVHEALNTDNAAALTPAERAALKPGEPGSGLPPPGVVVWLRKGIHRSERR